MSEPTKLEKALESIKNFHAVLNNMGLLNAAVEAATTPEAQDEARTLLWQACDLMDATVSELKDAMMEGTAETRAGIRRARLGSSLGKANGARPVLKVLE
jgi:hypothetical protein